MDEKKPPETLFQMINDQIEYLRKYQDQIIKPLNHGSYPLQRILFFYERQMLQKVKSRIDKSSLVSDLLYWFMPTFVAFKHEIDVFIHQNQIHLSERQINECNQQVLLRMPQNFFTHSIVNFCSQSEKWNQSREKLVQLKALQTFRQKYVSFLEQFDHNCSQNDENIKNKIICCSFQPSLKVNHCLKYVKRLLFFSKLKKRVQKANKNLEQRRLRILQLVEGDKKYVKRLEQYITYVKKPIEELKILSKDETVTLFSSIESIKGFHEQFHFQLQSKFNKYEKYQTYGDVIKRNVPFFKMYTEYIQYAPEADQMMRNLIQNNQDVQEITIKFMNEKEKNAVDELKQPTFRIAKYQMILDGIIKKTNPIHPDYLQLREAEKDLKVGLRKINEMVDSIMRRNKLNQLQQEFGTDQKHSYSNEREFLQEFSLFWIKDEKFLPIIVFVLTDFIFIIEENTRKKIKQIKIDQNFYVRREEDNKTYRNIIKVHSDGFLTFSAGNDDKNLQKAQHFYELLQRVSKQNQELAKLIYVQVIGTEQIGSTSFAKHTQYVVQIKFLGISKYLHIRFSQMSQITNKMKAFYKSNLGITSEEGLKKNWLNNHKSKIIEDRKRTIEQILQKIFNNEIVRSQPEYFLQYLGIDSKFLNPDESPRKKRQTLFNSGFASKIMSICSSNISVKKSKKEYKEPETILCATEIKLGRELYHDPDEALISKSYENGEKIQIYVQTMVKNEKVKVRITESNTIQDVCIKVSKLIGLRMNKDFRLFHEIGKKQLRVLEHEQKIMKIFSFPKLQIQPDSFIGGITHSFKKIFSPDTHPTLIFKKYYFLPFQIQQAETKKDLTRLRLLVYQIFAEIKDMKYQLSFDEYLLFLSMLIYMQKEGEINQDIEPEYVTQIIPQTILKLKNYSQEQWIAKCIPHLNRLHNQILKIIDYNREQLKNKKIKADSFSKTALYFGHKNLCGQIVINKIKSSPIYGSNLFYVQPYKTAYDKLVEKGCKMAYNMWLAIKVQSLNLLTPSSKQTVLELKYKDIEKIFVYSDAIIFKMDGIETTEYRLNTYQSFEISQLVKYNKALNQTLIQLERNEDLIERARMYKQQLLIYRNTDGKIK